MNFIFLVEQTGTKYFGALSTYLRAILSVPHNLIDQRQKEQSILKSLVSEILSAACAHKSY